MNFFVPRLCLVYLAVLLSGCALSPPAPMPEAARPAFFEFAPFVLNGRIAINHQGKHHSAGLRWTHGNSAGIRWEHEVRVDELLLLAPLGKTVARVYSDTRPNTRQATLDTDGKHYQADDVEALMEQVLGWHLPLGGLHQWVLGLTVADIPAQIERDDQGRITVLHQDGWEVRYLKYADARPDSMPTRLQLNREDLQVTLLIDEWEWLRSGSGCDWPVVCKD